VAAALLLLLLLLLLRLRLLLLLLLLLATTGGGVCTVVNMAAAAVAAAASPVAALTSIFMRFARGSSPLLLLPLSSPLPLPVAPKLRFSDEEVKLAMARRIDRCFFCLRFQSCEGSFATFVHRKKERTCMILHCL
jgi:hypothetical protein